MEVKRAIIRNDFIIFNLWFLIDSKGVELAKAFFVGKQLYCIDLEDDQNYLINLNELEAAIERLENDKNPKIRATYMDDKRWKKDSYKRIERRPSIEHFVFPQEESLCKYGPFCEELSGST